jgi:hypothetical protein
LITTHVFFYAKYSGESPHCVIFIYGAPIKAWLFTNGGQEENNQRRRRKETEK